MDPTPNEYDVGETIWLNARFLTGSTVATIREGQRALYVRDTQDLDVSVGATLVVVGAGAIGGDLVTTIASAAGQVITLTDPALSMAALVPVGNPAAPTTITCTVEQPDGSEIVEPTSGIGNGRFRASFVATMDGEHFYRFVGTGTATADRWRKFTVRPERVP